jgi:hypothetical protein
MRFQPRIRALIALSLAIAMAPGIAVAASKPTPGKPCKNYKEKVANGGNSFICVKSGKKLIWKLVIEKNRTTLENPTTIPTPETTSSAPIGYAERWNLIDSNALNAFRKAVPTPLAKNHKNIFIWQKSDKANEDAVSEIKMRYEKSAIWWSSYDSSRNPIKILIANHNEAEWICTQKLEWLNNMVQPECFTVESNGRSNIPTAGQFQRSDRQMDMYQVASKDELDKFFFYGRVEHEFTHNIFYAQATNYQMSVPCWLTEGGPEFFGNLMAFADNPDLYIQVRNFKIQTSNVGYYSENDWYQYLMRADGSENFSKFTDQCGPVRSEIYSHAILPNEYLVQKLGVTDYLKLIKLASETSWVEAISDVFSKSKSDLYSEIALYMKAQYDLINSNSWIFEEIRKVPYGR